MISRDFYLRLCDEALVDLYCEHQLETYEWLTGHGVRYGEVHAASGQSVPRSHPTDTTGMLVALLKAAGRLGARLLLDTAAERLVREAIRLNHTVGNPTTRI